MPRGDRKAISNFPIPLPPLPLQQLFAHRIEQIENQKAEVQKAIIDLETLLASRMQYCLNEKAQALMDATRPAGYFSAASSREN